MGSVKDKALNAMIDCHLAPSVYTRKEAIRLMREGDVIPAQIPNMASLRQAKSKALAKTKLHTDPIVALSIMKENLVYGSAIRDIGYDKFFVHIWSDLQIKVYNEYYSKVDVPSISFDATGSLCKKIRRSGGQLSNSIFLYEGVMKVDNKSFTVLSMLSEQHDALSICIWLKRWLRCGTQIPKEVVSDQSLALMSASVQAFTQYDSLEKYLKVCFSLAGGRGNEGLPSCFVRNDINHFIHLVAQWKPLKSSKYPRTKQLFCRAMGMLVFCKTMLEAEKILEAVFTVAISKYDGPILQGSRDIPENDEIKTPCAHSKLFLQNIITPKIVELVDSEQNPVTENLINNVEEEIMGEVGDITSFKDWARNISIKCEERVDGIIGQYDNAQYVPELVPIIINTMKLFPCWSAIMTPIFGYGEELASSSRIESQFNHLKNRLFKNDVMPLSIDNFTEKLVEYYRGDNLMLHSKNTRHDEFDMMLNDENSLLFEEELLDNGTACEETPHVNKTLCDEVSLVIEMADKKESLENTIFSANATHKNGKEINEDLNERPAEIDLDTQRCSPGFVSPVNLSLEKEKRSRSELVSCLACKNEDTPTGLHRCVQCEKRVHLFGCSIAAPNTEEGCGEKRICLDCDEIDSANQEINSVENWKRKGNSLGPVSKSSRSVKSYLNQQPGFNQINLNKKGKVTPIALLKNGSSLKNKPVYVPGVGKILLANTCSTDSLLTVLACSAADSDVYRQFLLDHEENDRTAKFVLRMVDNTADNKMYIDRVLLLFKHFQENFEQLIGGIKLVDTMDTATSIIKKLCEKMPSFYRKSQCTNLTCASKIIENTTAVISFNVFEGEISLQNEIDSLFSTTTVLCAFKDCGQERKVSLQPLQHVFVELVAVPQDLYTSNSFEQQSIILPQTSIKKNYAGSVMWQLNEIPKQIMIQKNTYYLRGFVAFSGPQRGNLRYASGHYMAYCFRSNDQWEFYDDTKDKVQVHGKKNWANIELLCYTI